MGLDQPILSAEEAAAAMQAQIDSAVMEETQVLVKKISLEYLTVISDKGEPEVLARADEKERCQKSENILAVNAITGEVLQEKREIFTE